MFGESKRILKRTPNFTHRGEIAAARNNDVPVETTIEKLGLDHHTLTELRRNAIRGALNPASRQIKLTEGDGPQPGEHLFHKLQIHLTELLAPGLVGVAAGGAEIRF